MRDIDDVMIFSSEYIMLKIIVDNTFDERLIINKLRKQSHVVDELKINLLLSSDIFNFEKMIVNYNCERLLLHCCRDMNVSIIVISIKQRINRVI